MLLVSRWIVLTRWLSVPIVPGRNLLEQPRCNVVLPMLVRLLVGRWLDVVFAVRCQPVLEQRWLVPALSVRPHIRQRFVLVCWMPSRLRLRRYRLLGVLGWTVLARRFAVSELYLGKLLEQPWCLSVLPMLVRLFFDTRLFGVQCVRRQPVLGQGWNLPTVPFWNRVVAWCLLVLCVSAGLCI